MPVASSPLEQVHRPIRTDPDDQEDVMSSIRTATRLSNRTFGRLDARLRVADSDRQLRAALAGRHGEGVRADVLAAMKR